MIAKHKIKLLSNMAATLATLRAWARKPHVDYSQNTVTADTTIASALGSLRFHR
jgi:hypothetical protein